MLKLSELKKSASKCECVREKKMQNYLNEKSEEIE
jgi:hypothetical protein